MQRQSDSTMACDWRHLPEVARLIGWEGRERVTPIVVRQNEAAAQFEVRQGDWLGTGACRESLSCATSLA
jgi:hypothetical protein